MSTISDNKPLVFAAIGVVVLVIVAAVFVYVIPEKTVEAPSKTVTVKHVKKELPVAKKRATRLPKSQKVKQTSEQTDKPNLELTADEESLLTDEMKAIMAELQDALDDDDGQRVSKIAEKILITQRKLGQDAVPPVVREKAVEALGFFLPGSLADLVGFMADSDPDVLQDVMDKFEEAIDDADLGDRDLAGILTTVAKILTNEDAIDALFFAIETDMRNSIAVETYLDILANGTEEVKAKVWESIQDFTNEDEISTPEDLQKWLDENPDDEDDEEFFSGKDTDDGDDDGDDSADDGDNGEDSTVSDAASVEPAVKNTASASN